MQIEVTRYCWIDLGFITESYQMKTTLRIVELETGQFAVQKHYWPTWDFMGKDTTHCWGRHDVKYIAEYCLMNSLEKAEKALEMHMNKIRMDKVPKPKIPRVVKVIKQVRV